MKILIGGDFCPENRAEKLLGDGEDIFSVEYKRIWNSTDFRILNLEGAITSSNSKNDKVGRCIKFDPNVMNGVKKMGVTHFSLANNHIMDYGEQGIDDTINYLKKSEIDFFGCHSQKTSILKKNDTKVAVLSFSNKEFSAMEINNGVGACSMDLISMLQQIEVAKKVTDHIIVILHTGLSLYPLPSPEQRRLCRFLIDTGVSAVLCQHSHIMGAYENYKEGFISYGQGSFVFELGRKNTVWNKGYSILFDFKKDGRSINIIPHKQFDESLNICTLTQIELDEFHSSMDKLNQSLCNDDEFSKAWELYLNKVEKYYFNQFFLPKNRVIRRILNLINFKIFFSKSKRNIVLSNLRNDEHAEIIKEILLKG